MTCVDGSEILVSHLSYVDDIIIFCGAEPEQLGYLLCMLVCRQTVLSLKVNLGVRAHSSGRDRECGGSSIYFPPAYLGLPLGACH